MLEFGRKLVDFDSRGGRASYLDVRYRYLEELAARANSIRLSRPVPGCLVDSEASRAFGPQLRGTANCALSNRHHHRVLDSDAQALAARTTKLYGPK